MRSAIHLLTASSISARWAPLPLPCGTEVLDHGVGRGRDPERLGRAFRVLRLFPTPDHREPIARYRMAFMLARFGRCGTPLSSPPEFPSRIRPRRGGGQGIGGRSTQQVADLPGEVDGGLDLEFPVGEALDVDPERQADAAAVRDQGAGVEEALLVRRGEGVIVGDRGA